jgi:proteic killer suppression protein
VIASFGDKATEALYNGGPKKDFKQIPPEILKTAFRKLDMVNAAAKLDDLKVPPSNHLHLLERDLAGFHAIKINDQWRVVFRWQGSDAFDVQITDYH